MMKRLILLSILTLLVVVPNVIVGSVEAQTTDFPALTTPGPYGVRLQKMTIVDKSRGDWKLEVGVFYPVDKTKGTPVMPDSLILKDAPPDRSGAPYPLIIYSHNSQGSSAEFIDTKALLVSHGYVIVAPSHHDTKPMSHEFVDRPLDILLILNELSSLTDGDLAGMIDTENVGLMGYSQGGVTALQMLGLLNNPVSYKKWCADHPDLAGLDCKEVPIEETSAYRMRLGLQNMPDGQWTPFGDKRIHAVLAMAVCDFPLTTDEMLAAVTTPTMILHGTKDEFCDYEGNAVNTYTHLGTQDRYLITAIDADHYIWYHPKLLSQHFSTAFFGYYLKGDKTYQPYLTQENLPVLSHPKLILGAYEGQ